MSMPLENATRIWIAAIADAAKIHPEPIDKDRRWQRYMALTQLEIAFDNTTIGLRSAGWEVKWTLAEVHATNPVKTQCALLAERAKYVGGAPLVIQAIASTPSPKKGGKS